MAGKKTVLQRAGWCLAMILAMAYVAQAAPIVQDFGPFHVTFYNAGDSVRLSTSSSLTGAQNWTAQQIADMGASIQAWDSQIDNTQGRQIKMSLVWRELDSYGTSVLGGSASPNYGDGNRSWNYGEHVWRDGANLPTGAGTGLWGDWDTLIQYDVTAAGFSWNFGADAPASNEIDFRTVLTHELGHSLGFSPTLDYSSPGYYDDWGNCWGSENSSGSYKGYKGLSAWDSFLVDSHGNHPVNAGLGLPGNFDQVDNPVYFDGANARALNGGTNVAIYAPATYAPGSSLSHLNESTFPNALMSPFVSLGQMVREPTVLEWAMMQDMNWDVPEPATLSLLALGGLALIRRRRKSA